MSERLTAADDGRSEIRPTLARVEGEGAMYVQLRDGEVLEVQLRIYEPPRLLRGASARPLLHRGPGHHGADLRDLPRRLPDERLPRRSRTRCGVDVSTGRCAPAPADLLRRVDREPRPARLPAARARLPRLRERHRHGARPPRGRRARAADEEGRQPADRADRRPRGAPGQRAGRRLLPGAPTSDELEALREPLEQAREDALETVRWAAALAFPDLERDYEFVALRSARASTRSTAAGSSRSRGTRHRPLRNSTSTFVEEQVPHSTALHSRVRGRGVVPGRAAGPLQSQRRPSVPACAGGRGARRDRLGMPQPVPEHRRAGRRDPLRLRRGAAPDRRIRAARAAPRSSSSRAPAVGYGVTEAPRGLLYHRYEIDADGRSPTRRSSPPPRRTSRRSRRTCGLRPGDTSTWTTRSSPCAASRRSATTTRASPARPISSAWRSTAVESEGDRSRQSPARR